MFFNIFLWVKNFQNMSHSSAPRGMTHHFHTERARSRTSKHVVKVCLWAGVCLCATACVESCSLSLSLSIYLLSSISLISGVHLRVGGHYWHQQTWKLTFLPVRNENLNHSKGQCHPAAVDSYVSTAVTRAIIYADAKKNWQKNRIQCFLVHLFVYSAHLNAYFKCQYQKVEVMHVNSTWHCIIKNIASTLSLSLLHNQVQL